jgi:prepilin-type N-terminal cleavage/methylation domain-containing protein/prepilin-type processing-associated H-X9-DG protein
MKNRSATRGFTLLELLVVLAVLAVLSLLCAGTLHYGLERSKQAKCASNLRQIQLANALYASDRGYYASAAPDMFSANLRRWHGTRASTREPFSGTDGPLSDYLGQARQIRACPAFREYQGHDTSANTFESSCGGYGYNDRGVGSLVYQQGYNRQAMQRGMPPDQIKDPARTVMFCDTAFPQPYSRPEYVIEYSFAEAYHFVMGNPPRESSATAMPSIHFRHRGHANVAWCDGHISAERMTLSDGPSMEEFEIGWFGPPDNSLFDPF